MVHVSRACIVLTSAVRPSKVHPSCQSALVVTSWQGSSKCQAVLTVKEDPAWGLEIRTKRFDVTPALLNMLKQPGADKGPSAAITASMGAVTPGSTCHT